MRNIRPFFCTAILFLASALFPNCSSLVWREAPGENQTAFVSGNEFVEIHLSYEEKNSWNPLDGTTLKRNYTSTFRLLTVQNESVNVGPELFTFQGWVRSDSVYPINTRRIIFIGGENDEYAGNEHAIYINANGTATSLMDSSNGKIVQCIPSGDGRRLVFLIDTGTDAYVLRAGELSESSLNLFEWQTEILPAAGPTWSLDGDTIYIQNAGGDVIEVDAKTGSRNATRSFPACFHPATSMGGDFSDGGLQLYRESSDAPYTVNQVPDWKPFRNVPRISDPDKIGSNCL